MAKHPSGQVRSPQGDEPVPGKRGPVGRKDGARIRVEGTEWENQRREKSGEPR